MREMESDSHTPENQQFSTGNDRSLQTKSNEQLKTYPLTLSQQSTNRPQQYSTTCKQSTSVTTAATIGSTELGGAVPAPPGDAQRKLMRPAGAAWFGGMISPLLWCWENMREI